MPATTPEIPCASCNQNVSADRERCPYCGTPVEAYWFWDARQPGRAVAFTERGRRLLVIEGMKFEADSPDLPPALHGLFPPPRGGVEEHGSLKKRLQHFLFQTLLQLPPPPKPSQWDTWLDSQEVPGDGPADLSVSPQRRPFTVQEFCDQLTRDPRSFTSWKPPPGQFAYHLYHRAYQLCVVGTVLMLLMLNHCRR